MTEGQPPVKITGLRHGSGKPVIAHFDWEVSKDLKLLNWTLKRGPDGQLRAYPPNLRHNAGSAVAITSSLVRHVCAAALEFMQQGGRAPHDDQNKA